jgi:hypothetical protein
MRRFFAALWLVCLAWPSVADNVFYPQSDLDYLPTNVTYDPAITLPQEVLGDVVGTWHVRHDQLVNYMKLVASQSDRITLEVTGRTHENRELLQLVISSTANQARIGDIRATHMQHVNNGTQPAQDAPVILYMGYSIHGNEPSGSNAALLIAYYLAAAQGEAVDNLLDNAVILLDPSMNPDGLARFAQWTNMHKGQHPSASPYHREHRERFPSGRTNHYWFDLNRDWLLLTHPESQARIAQFQAWRPHVLTDFHEMGTNATYFFQPGVPDRTHPLTNPKNIALTNVLAKYHADALDGQTQLYYSKERFDDFYYGKGSTYPDAHGTVGILFEQASSRGAEQMSINGLLNFPMTIKNQLTTTFSTFAGTLANKAAFLAHPQNFYSETRELIKQDDEGGFLVLLSDDQTRNQAFVEKLRAHRIAVQMLDSDVSLDKQSYRAGRTLFISLQQPQYRLLKSLFSEQQSFANNTFYDVSNWNMPLAFNLDYVRLSKRHAKKIKASQIDTLALKTLPIQPGAVAYAMPWDDANAPAVLNALLDKGVMVRLATQPFTGATLNGQAVELAPGTMVFNPALNRNIDLARVITEVVAEYPLAVYSLTTGLTTQGIDLGSPSMLPVNQPRVAILTGVGVSQYDVGTIWHYLDTRVGMPLTMLDKDRLSNVDLAEFTHLIMASGNYSDLSEARQEQLEAWVNAGGTLIAQRTALGWLADTGWLKATVGSRSEVRRAVAFDKMRFADQSIYRALQQVAGSVHMANVDPTHPLLWGVTSNETLPLFKTSSLRLLADDSAFIEAAQYREYPLVAGYTAPQVNELIGNTSALVAHRKGEGRIIAIVDVVNFRGYWRGTEKIMANAIFMSDAINVR